MPRSSLSSSERRIWLQQIGFIHCEKTLFPECPGAECQYTETLDIPLKYQYHNSVIQ